MSKKSIVNYWTHMTRCKNEKSWRFVYRNTAGQLCILYAWLKTDNRIDARRLALEAGLMRDLRDFIGAEPGVPGDYEKQLVAICD